MNFISNEHDSFAEIIKGIDEEDIAGDLEYRRVGDKKDKSLEIYKFYINSLYVAVTRAVQKLYLIESRADHPLISMLGIQHTQETMAVEEKQSSIEEWQAEAHRLELQGRQEQADEIRRDILKTQPVPWEVCTPEKTIQLLARACDKKDISQKPGKTLLEYGLFYDEPMLIRTLILHGFSNAGNIYYMRDGHHWLNIPLYEQKKIHLKSRYLQKYSGRFFKDIIRECELYGVDHRNMFNKTPLMMAAIAGNVALIEHLLAAGADMELTDNYGMSAWQSALQRTIDDKKFMSELFPAVHELIAPGTVSLKSDDRLLKIDSKQGEFLVFHIFFASFRQRINSGYAETVPLTAVTIANILAFLPDSVIPAYRKKRAYVSALLSKNETGSTNPYGRKLFRRRRTGHYILNPKLSIRKKDDWIDIYQHANIELITKTAERGDEQFRAEVLLLISDKPHSYDAVMNKPPAC
jgi:hypothetical protein